MRIYNLKPFPWIIDPLKTEDPEVWRRMVWATPFLNTGATRQEVVRRGVTAVDASLGWRAGLFGWSPAFAGGTSQLLRIGNAYTYPSAGAWTAVAAARYVANANFQGLIGKFPSLGEQRQFSLFMDGTQTLAVRNNSGGSYNSAATVPSGFYIFAVANHPSGGTNSAAYAIEMFTGRVVASLNSYGLGGATDLTADVTIGDIDRHFGAWQSDMYYAFTTEEYWSLERLRDFARNPFAWLHPKQDRRHWSGFGSLTPSASLDRASVVYTTGGGTNTATVNAPNNIVAGKMLCVTFGVEGGTSLNTLPTGWQILHTLPEHGSMIGYIVGKIATGSEPATYDFVFSTATTSWGAEAFVVNNADLSSFPTSVIDDTELGTANGASVSVTGPTTTEPRGLLIGLAVSRGTGAEILGPGMNTLGIATRNLGSRTMRTFWDFLQQGATPNRTFNVSASTFHNAGLLAIKAAPAVVGGGELVPADSVQTQIVDIPALVQANVLVPIKSAQIQSVAIPALLQAYSVVPLESIQIQAVDVPVLSQANLLAAIESLQTQHSDIPSLLQQNVLGTIEAVQTQHADVPTPTQAHLLTVAKAVQLLAADVPTLSTIGTLTPIEAVQLLVSAVPGLLQSYILSVQEGVQGQFSDIPTLSFAVQIIVQTAIQGQFADVPVLTQANILSVHKALQLQYGDTPSLLQSYVLQAIEAYQLQVGDNPTLLGLITVLQVLELRLRMARDKELGVTLASNAEFKVSV